jgi:hypothetical protein
MDGQCIDIAGKSDPIIELAKRIDDNRAVWQQAVAQGIQLDPLPHINDPVSPEIPVVTGHSVINLEESASP